MEDIAQLLETLKKSPYEEIPVVAPHTGTVRLSPLKVGDTVKGTSGEWKEIPGTVIATLTREHNQKDLTAAQSGTLLQVNEDVNGNFVEAGTVLAVIRHFLTRDEVIAKILRHALFLFNAPERAKYFFPPVIDAKIKSQGCRSFTVHSGMELLIMTRMKRETPVCYTGPDGIIYDVYFKNNQNVEAGAPLIGICTEARASAIEDIIFRIHSEWKDV